MVDLEDKPHFILAETIVDAQCILTQVSDRAFFRNLVAFSLCQIASSMRVNIYTQDRGIIPINSYVINLAPSGFSKNKSLAIIKDKVINQFRYTFIEETLPIITEEAIMKIATDRAIKNNTEQDEEIKKVTKEIECPYLFSFDSGTSPAYKQFRRSLLMIKAGSLNFIMGEIASNLAANAELFAAYLESYDTGEISEKLIKHTKDNVRAKEIIGRVPANMLLFGEPTKLLDGSKNEEDFDKMLATGYARRCLFGFGIVNEETTKLTAIELFHLLKDPTHENNLKTISDKLGRLADKVNFNKTIYMSDEVSIELLQYKLDCEEIGSALGEHESIRKAEVTHRYFKVLKLAGAYAFIDDSSEIEMYHLHAAMKLVEDSGKAFDKILTRERPYVRLAKYLASTNTEVTQVDLIEANVLKGSESQKRELITLATAYGYKNNIIIKKLFIDGIEFLKGESLKETNLDKLILACSTQLAEGYNPVVKNTSWKDLHILTQMDGYHWINHHMIDNYRLEKNAIPGFNMIVIDVDGGISLATAQLLLKEYTYLIYTTKRHTDKENRFRIVFPISHELKLNAEDFTEFMQNIYAWLPFKVDDQTAQRSRKWLSHKGEYHYNEGTLLDALGFIPKTAKAEEQKKRIVDTQSLTNMERWFVSNTGEGNRSNQLIKYALLLVDSGLSEDVIQSKVLELNNKIPNKLEETEIHITIMKSVFKAIAKRDI